MSLISNPPSELASSAHASYFPPPPLLPSSPDSKPLPCASDTPPFCSPRKFSRKSEYDRRGGVRACPSSSANVSVRASSTACTAARISGKNAANSTPILSTAASSTHHCASRDDRSLIGETPGASESTGFCLYWCCGVNFFASGDMPDFAADSSFLTS
eukprot:5678678-Prymnesium_polylepis.2